MSTHLKFETQKGAEITLMGDGEFVLMYMFCNSPADE